MDGHENNLAVVQGAAKVYTKLRQAWDVFSILDGSVLVGDEEIDRLAGELADATDEFAAALDKREELLRLASGA